MHTSRKNMLKKYLNWSKSTIGKKESKVYLWLFILLFGIPRKTKLKLLNFIERIYSHKKTNCTYVRHVYAVIRACGGSSTTSTFIWFYLRFAKNTYSINFALISLKFSYTLRLSLLILIIHLYSISLMNVT